MRGAENRCNGSPVSNYFPSAHVKTPQGATPNMPGKVIPLPKWIPQACELMAKYDLSLKQAAAELGIDLTVEEAEALQGRKLFKQCLEEKRLAHDSEIGSNPKLIKEAVVGIVVKLAERLANDREDLKGADALLKLAKMQGWVGTNRILGGRAAAPGAGRALDVAGGPEGAGEKRRSAAR
jgi:hypothetical protein